MAAPPVGTGDPSTQQLLDSAYTQARQDPALQGTPSNLMQSYKGPPGGSSVSDASIGLTRPDPPPGSMSVDEPPDGATNPFDQYRDTPPQGAQSVVDQKTHGNGDMWSLSNMGDFLRDEFAGSQEEAGKGVMRGLAKVGSAATVLGAGAVASIADHAANVITGGTHTGAEDKVFDFKKDYIDPAIEYWTPQRQDVTGQGEGSGGAAQALGGASELAPALVTGGAGGVGVLAGTATDSATGAIDKGHSLRTAAAEAAVDTIGTAIQMELPGSELPFVKRVMAQVPMADVLNVAQQWTKKQILSSSGHQKEADAIDPMGDLGQNSLQQVIFSAMGGKGPKEVKPVAGAAPVPEAQPVPQAAAPAAPQPPPPVAKPAAAPSPTAAHPVGDTPSPEPAKDLKAQWIDMNSAATPRTGVLLPKGQDTSIVAKGLEQATAQGRVLQLDQGALVLKNKAEFLKARAELNNTGDTEALIGRVTGAGAGKTPDQTAVVQGQTKAGAVATESMVKPEEVAAKVAAVQAEGKQPVVTTPEAAVQRRQTEIQAEAAAKPPEGAQPVADATKPPEGAAPVEAAKPSDEESEEEPSAPTAKRAIVKTAAGERAVILEGEPEGGKQKVRLLDDEGQPSAQVVSVPSETVRGEAEPAAPEPAKEAPAKPAEKIPVVSDDKMRDAGLTESEIRDQRRNPDPDKLQKIVDGYSYIEGQFRKITPDDVATYRKGAKEQQAEGESQRAAFESELAKPKGSRDLSRFLGDDWSSVGGSNDEAARAKFDQKYGAINGIAERYARVTGEKPAKAPAIASKAEPEIPAKDGKPAPAIDQLKDATNDFAASQVPPKGRKYPGSVKDRAQDVGTFARALKGVAESLAGKAPVGDLQHAIATAKKAERIDVKSDESMAKGQGVGHTELATHAENLINAAKKLINPDFERPEPKVARQEKLKAKQAAKKAAPEPYTMNQPEGLRTKEEIEAFNDRVLGKTKEKPAEKVKVIEDIPDETKPKELSKSEQIKLRQAGDKLIKAKPDKADAAAADVERILHEIYGDKMSKDDHDTFMAYLMGERRDRLRPKSRDQEIEDELGAKGVDYRSAEPDELEHVVLGNHEVGKEVADLHARLEKSGMYSAFRDATGKKQFPARDILQHMAGQTHNAPLQDLILRIARNLPENAVIRPVEKVVRMNGLSNENEAGLANNDTNDIQIKVKAGGDSRMTHTLLHEATHLVTANLGRQDPTHPFVQETKRLRQIFENRMRRRLGDDVVQQHVDYLAGRGDKPAEYYNDLYGLKNHAEFLAEAGSNPQFRRIIAQSEKYADRASEGFLGGVHRLADAIVDTLRRALGVDNTKGAKLLHSVMTNLEDTITAQRQRLDLERPTAAEDLSQLAHLDADPKPLRDEPRLRGIVGRTGSVIARQWYRSTQGFAVPALRRTVLANETHDQIIRSNAHWFGHDNEANPLREYDAAVDQKNAMINRHLERARPIVLARQKLERVTDTALGNLQSDSTRWGIDPSKDKTEVAAKYSKATDFDKRWDDLQARWKALPEGAQHVYQEERDHYAWAQRQLRRTAVDAALDTFSDRDVTGAQRSLLYNARTRGDFESLVGTGRLVDVGDRNDSLRKSLQELAGVNHMEGPYFHLGRRGEYVVQVHPDVDQNFDSQAEAEAHAQKVRDMGPGSKAKVAEVGGKWNVEGKAQYVSMHDNRADAEEERQRLRDAGHKVGPVTAKIEAESGGALTKAMQGLVSEATRKLSRRAAGDPNKPPTEVTALTDALRSTLVQMVANRSAYAASKLSRAGFAGVKGEEMGRNFATHSQSMAWNIGNLATTFRQGEALGKIREMSKAPTEDTPQRVVYKRGAVMRELGKRAAQEVSQYGIKNPVNAVLSKLGYMNFLASPSHTGIYLTQNFTTAFPVAGARWGYGKSLAAFARATQAVVSPAMRATFKAAKPGEFGADDMTAHVLDAIKQHPTMGKWAPQLRELMDRGIISNTFAHEVGNQAHGGNPAVQRAFDYARIMPQMAEVYNRVSTALAGLELTGGHLQKTADFVRETHVDYSQGNKTRVGKAFTKWPGGNTVTMFHTYLQGMRHLLYSNVKNMVTAETKSRGEAAKTVGGLVLAMSLSAGVIKGAALEPLRGAVYAYNKIFGNDDEFYSLDNSIRRFVASVVGNKTASDTITGGLPHLLGFDLSSRMGLSDLFLHDPPDLLGADKKQMLQFLGEQLGGPIGQMVAEQSDAFKSAMHRGDAFGMFSAFVPVKFLRDVGKAAELATTGHRTAQGARITQPSAMDALTQTMGFKPADVARAQQRQGDVAEYREFIDQRKQAILGAWGKSDTAQRAVLRQEINTFNAKNPGDRIKVQDLIKIQRGALKSQQRIETGNDANPNIKKILSY